MRKYLQINKTQFIIKNDNLTKNKKYRTIEPGYCNFFKAVTTLKSKPVQIKINLIHGSIN